MSIVETQVNMKPTEELFKSVAKELEIVVQEKIDEIIAAILKANEIPNVPTSES